VEVLLNLKQIVSSGAIDLINIDTSKNREKILAILTVAIIITMVIFVSIIDPRLKERKTKHRQLSNLQLRLTKIKSDILVKDRIDNLYQQIEPLLESGENQQQEISLFTRQLSDIYSKLNVKIRSVKILPVSNENFYRKLAIKLEMSCHVRELLKFVHELETIGEAVKIEKLDLKTADIVDNLRLSLLISKVVAKTPEK
jgi:Tfp pilus assembly protein PilO